MYFSHLKYFIPCQNHHKMREDGDFVIITSEALDIYFLNEVSKAFYYLVDGKRTLEKIIEALLDMYEVSKDVLIDDIMIIVRDLQWKKILILREK